MAGVLIAPAHNTTRSVRSRCTPSGPSGWSTFWIGKNHNVAEQDVASGASRKQWPLQKGFDRFYGFLGGETNQWYPDLVEDNRFYAMLGTRGIWEDGWLAASVHAPISGKGHFDKDAWQLYHVDVDRSESKDLAAQHPDKLQALIKTWFDEADKNNVLPLDDRTALEVLGTPRPSDEPARERYIYYPETAPVPEGVAVNVRGRSFKILANIEIAAPSASGVIFAHGSRFGGHSLFIKDRKLHYVYNFLGIKPEQHFVSGQLKPGKYTVGMEFIRESGGEHGESLGKAKLYVNDKLVAEGPMKTQPGKFTLSGDGLCVGYDSGDAVSQEYKTPGKFKGGMINFVGVSVEKTQYLQLESEARRVMSVQ